MLESINTLSFLLRCNQQYDVQYQQGLSNHLSMALIALFFLGATKDELQAYFDRYSIKLEFPPKATQQFNKGNWQQYIGQHRFYQDFYHFFQQESQSLEILDLLRLYLPILLPGLGAAAFHALIRLAYAVELYETGLVLKNGLQQDVLTVAKYEILTSLAYWADSYLHLPIIGGKQSIEAGIQQLVATEPAASYANHFLIYQRMAQVCDCSPPQMAKLPTSKAIATIGGLTVSLSWQRRTALPPLTSSSLVA